MRSIASFRGSFVDDTTGREVVYESTLERDLAYILAIHPNVRSYQEQPDPVSYTIDGRSCHHTFDFLVTSVTGERIALAVKPAAKVERSGLPRIISAITKQIGTRFADRYEVRTEHQISRDRACDARLIFRARRLRDPALVEAMRRTVMRSNGLVTITDLIALHGDGDGLLIPIVNLIDEGALTLVSTGRITLTSHVSCVREN